jgi:hypothetical protein
MPRRPLEERDLRSLQRRSMYSIFQPLDPAEPLTRELVREAKRQRYFSVKRMEIAAYLYLPALMLTILAVSALHGSVLMGFAAAGVLLAGFFVYAMIGEWR